MSFLFCFILIWIVYSYLIGKDIQKVDFFDLITKVKGKLIFQKNKKVVYKHFSKVNQVEQKILLKAGKQGSRRIFYGINVKIDEEITIIFDLNGRNIYYQFDGIISLDEEKNKSYCFEKALKQENFENCLKELVHEFKPAPKFVQKIREDDRYYNYKWVS